MRSSPPRLQPDGKILVGGSAALASNSDGTGLTRLNADGSFDTSFHPEMAGGDYTVINSLARQPDGKILAGGYFVQSDVPYYLLTRLNADGSRDPNFPAPGGSAVVTSIVLQPDGKILAASGWYDTAGWIARFNTNGSVDNTFNGGSGANDFINSVLLQSDGKVLIAGSFTTVNGIVRPRIFRLLGESVAPFLSVARSNAFVVISWPSPSTGFVLQQNTNLNTTNWTTPSEAVTNTGTTQCITVSSVGQNRFYRLFKP